jgi:hypothetical protein
MNDINVEELVEVYLTIRRERDRAEKEHEAAMAVLKADMAQIEAALLDVCNKVKVNSLNTKFGTVIRKLNERYVCNDWDGFKSFVLEHQAVDLFEKRIHQGNFKQFLSEHDKDGLPPGVNVMREFAISVRKSSTESIQE